jgi:membrane protease YdiL (CAAX protease family)
VTKTNLSSAFVAQGRLRAGWRVTLYVTSYVSAQLIIQVPLVIALVACLLVVEGEQGMMAVLQSGSYPLWFVFLLKVGETALLLPLTYVLGRWIDKRRFVTFGFRLDRGWLVELVLGLALGTVQMLAVFGVEWMGGWLSVGWLDSAALLSSLVQGALATVTFFLVAVGEELLFRGYVQVNLQEGSGNAVALLVSSLLFSLFHILNPNLNWIGVANIALAGLALGYGRLATGNLWLPMAYHLSWNLVQGAVLALPVSGMRYGGLLAVVDIGKLPWLTGADFGPEGGLVGTLALLTAFPVFWLWGRLRKTRASVLRGSTPG